MKTHHLAAVVPLALIFLTLMIPVAHAAESADSGASFRPARVRAFVPEPVTSLLVREGRSNYRRLMLAESCPALTQATRVAFQSGSALSVTDEQGRQVPVVRGKAPTVVSTETRNAFVVSINGNKRTVCRLSTVSAVDQAAFEAAAAVHGRRDNRYAGDGRPAG